MVTFILVFFLAAAFSLLLTPLVAGVGLRVGIVDYPDVRKVHTVVTPRVGGAAIALALGIALAMVLGIRHQLDAVLPVEPGALLPIVAGGLVIFALGLWDDANGLTAGLKLLGQLVAAGIVAGSGIVINSVSLFGEIYELSWLGVPLTLLWIIGITNAFNLVDGVDGLAGGLASIAATTCAIVLFLRGDYAEALLLVALVGAVIGFLPYNSSPAVIFLGDSGSLLCGFVLAVTAIAGRQKGATALAVGVPLLTFALPIADTTLSILRRFVRGQIRSGRTPRERVRALSSILVADQEHIHHRLLARGLSHRRTAVVLYVLSCVCSVLALLTSQF